MYQTEIFVHFDETDAGGIVFFGNYFKLAHRVIEKFLSESEVGWAAWFRAPDYGVPLRHVEADYLKALRAGNTYKANLSVVKLGDSSVTFQCELSSTEGPHSIIRTTHVFFDTKLRQKRAIPDPIRKLLSSNKN